MLPTTVKHRYTGEQITFVERTKDYTIIEVTLPANGDGPPLHKHDRYEEHFEVISGQLTVTVNKKTTVLKPGDAALVRLKQAHRFTNAHPEPVTFRVTLTPRCDFETSVRIHYGLMDDNLTDDKGNPKSFTHLAIILYFQNTWIAGIPISIQRFIAKRILAKAEKNGTLKELEKYYIEA